MSRTQDNTVGGTGNQSVIASIGAFWTSQRREYSDGKLIYHGCNIYPDAEITATDWEIWKYTYSGDNITLEEGPLQGAWDDRKTLAWSKESIPYNKSTQSDDSKIIELLTEILKHIKITNIQLSLISNEEIKEFES